MVTLLALGLPGGGNTAVMLGAFAMHNVVPAPRFIADHKDIVYSIVIGNLAQAVLLIIIGVPFLRIAVSVIKVPLCFLLPMILVFTILGSNALVGNMMGPITLTGAAIFGTILKRYEYSVVAKIIGVLLGLADGRPRPDDPLPAADLADSVRFDHSGCCLAAHVEATDAHLE